MLELYWMIKKASTDLLLKIFQYKSLPIKLFKSIYRNVKSEVEGLGIVAASSQK